MKLKMIMLLSLFFGVAESWACAPGSMKFDYLMANPHDAEWGSPTGWRRRMHEGKEYTFGNPLIPTNAESHQKLKELMDQDTPLCVTGVVTDRRFYVYKVERAR